MTCHSEFQLQIGLQDIILFSVPQAGKGVGQSGNKFSCQVKILPTQTPPKERQIINYVYYPATGQPRKLFGGEVLTAQLMSEYLPTRIYNVTGAPFSILAQRETFSYDSKTEAPIETVMQEITKLARVRGVPDPTNGAQLLNYIIQRPSGPVYEPSGDEPDPTYQHIVLQGVTLDTALNQIIGKYGFSSWYIDNGLYIRNEFIPTAGSLANIWLFRKDFVRPKGPTLNMNPGFCLKNITTAPVLTLQARQANRVVVTKDAASLAVGDLDPNLERPPFRQDIDKGSEQNFIRLQKNTTKVDAAFIVAF